MLQEGRVQTGQAETADRPLATKVVVKAELIAGCLQIYKPDCRLVLDATYCASERCLEATFAHYPLDFHQVPLKHLSRVQIIHYLGQAAFVLGGCLARSGMLPGIDFETYLNALVDERVTFRNVALDFREFLANDAGTAILIAAKRIHSIRGTCVAQFTFTVDNGGCRGTAEGLFLPTTRHQFSDSVTL